MSNEQRKSQNSFFDAVYHLGVLSLWIAAIAVLGFFISSCSTADSLLQPGSPKEAVIAIYGEPMVTYVDRSYWCYIAFVSPPVVSAHSARWRQTQDGVILHEKISVKDFYLDVNITDMSDEEYALDQCKANVRIWNGQLSGKIERWI